MYKDKKILCVIPARGGSKRLPGKNIKPLLGLPLIAYAIAAAKGSAYLDRVVVSTDSQEIAAVSKQHGAEVIMRPPELATDTANIVPAYQHAVAAAEEGGAFDLVVLVQPTVPGVLAGDIGAAIEKIISTGARSCISICEIVDRPEFMYRLGDGGMLAPYSDVPAGRTQNMEPFYRVNGAVYVTQRSVLMDEGKIIDPESCASVLMPRERSTDIDTELDFVVAEASFRSQK